MGETIKMKCNKFSVILETWKFGLNNFGVLSKLEKELEQFSVSFRLRLGWEDLRVRKFLLFSGST
jgi:hypothetical protein